MSARWVGMCRPSEHLTLAWWTTLRSRPVTNGWAPIKVGVKESLGPRTWVAASDSRVRTFAGEMDRGAVDCAFPTSPAWCRIARNLRGTSNRRFATTWTRPGGTRDFETSTSCGASLRPRHGRTSSSSMPSAVEGLAERTAPRTVPDPNGTRSVAPGVDLDPVQAGRGDGVCMAVRASLHWRQSLALSIVGQSYHAHSMCSTGVLSAQLAISPGSPIASHKGPYKTLTVVASAA